MLYRGFLVLSVVALTACTPDEEPDETVDWAVFDAEQQAAQQATPVATTQGDVGAQLNAARAANGLPALSRSAQLTAAAQVHVNDLVANRSFSHTGSDGSKPSQRVRRQGYSFCYVAENIAQGQRTAQEVMASWMSSPGHRANNLSRKATEYGVARGAGDLWVLVFAQPGC